MRLMLLLCLLTPLVLSALENDKQKSEKKKKSLADYSEADLDRLYEEWEANDEDELEEDELPPHKRKPTAANIDLDALRKEAASPEDMMRRVRKGQTLMMFVGVVDPARPEEKASRDFTDKWTGIWHSNLYNNHMDVQVFVIEDNRAIFMFTDGAAAFEAKDFLVKQPAVAEVTLEGNTYHGPAGKGEDKDKDKAKDSAKDKAKDIAKDKKKQEL